MGAGQQQTDPTEVRCSDCACLPALNGSRTDSPAAEHADLAETGSLLSSVPQRPASRRSDASVQATELDGLYALRQAADLKGLRRTRGGLLSNSTLAKLATASKSVEPIETSSFAAPLSPLRARDIQALSEFFLRDDIYAIEADVNQRLLTLLPEPCWEDKVFTFLKEFL